MAAIAVTRGDLTAIELRAAAGREKDSAASRRMLALAMVFDGAGRTVEGMFVVLQVIVGRTGP
jgi:hypothetical protein